MAKLREFFDEVMTWTVIIATSGLAIILGLLVIALPFIAIGLGIGVVSWVTCLLAPFC